MSYKNDIPKLTDATYQSQVDIANNFSEISQWLRTDHVDFNSSDSGKHQKVTLLNTTDPTTGATELALFRKSGETGYNSLYWRNISNGAQAKLVGGNAGGDDWKRFDGGLMIKWGYVEDTVPASKELTFNFPAAGTFPGFTNVFFACPSSVPLSTATPQVHTPSVKTLTATSAVLLFTATGAVRKINVIVFGN